MSRFLLLVCVVVGGYFAYQTWFIPESEAVVKSPAAAPAKPQRVDFAVKSRVSRLFAEWKRRQLGDPLTQKEHGAATVDPTDELKAIRQHLFQKGRYADSAMGEVVAASLRELGVAEGEIGALTGEILSMRGAQ